MFDTTQNMILSIVDSSSTQFYELMHSISTANQLNMRIKFKAVKHTKNKNLLS